MLCGWELWQEVALHLLQASPLNSSGLDTGHIPHPPTPGPASFLAREVQHVGKAPGEAGGDGRSQKKSGQASGL